MSASRDWMIYFEYKSCRKVIFWNKNMRSEYCNKQSNPESKIEIEPIDQENTKYQQTVNEKILKQNQLENQQKRISTEIKNKGLISKQKY